MEPYTIGHQHFENVKVPLNVGMNLSEVPQITKGTCYSIIILEEGTCIAQIEEKKILADAPYLFILNEEETLKVEKQSDAKWHILCFDPAILDNHFTFSYIRNADRSDVTSSDVQNLYMFNVFLLRENEDFQHFRITQMSLHRMISLLYSIGQELKEQNSYYWICRGRSFLIEILCYLSQTLVKSESFEQDIPVLQKVAENKASDYHSDKMEDLLLYIHTNYSKKLTINSLVNYSNMNRTSISELFRRYIGDSFVSYLTRLRIHTAALMLQETGLLVKEIAYRVGYGDLTHFNRSFKKITGYTPGDYRKEYSWLQQ